jgi:NADPH:quinone reductase-like Zn-dependent oxidoreductase
MIFMKAAVLVKTGDSSSCFEIRDMEKPKPKKGEVLIKVKGFGLNYADVMARHGNYRDAPPLPSVLGYDVVGIVESVGEAESSNWVGKLVAAVTHFGGYAEYALASELAIAEVPSDMPLASAAALATQYATAHYAVFTTSNVQQGETVFIHAAAGGVGLALIQFCKLKNCTIYGTVSSDKKAAVISELGVQNVINSSRQNVLEEITKLNNKLDVVFDSVGGKGVKLGFKALRAGGRIVCYGGSKLGEGSGIFNLIRFGLSFGFYHPIQFLAQSKSMIGIGMLRVMQDKPGYLKVALRETLDLLKENKIKMPIGESFPISKLFEAHQYLESRKSVGKIVVEW